ncbi:lysylphosphatidylglycerol synthase transmembrane domain-containing protein [Maribacter sp. TH_r10]|uniref:Flippase-like domain-containing protein n=1 Tax=Maribacter luteus TaxID=2594478 RepID=A0A6I2MLC8_9FLAO|nr:MULTISPECIES: lysylphosphatidylglycerol synthase transmembrane domain-containing protein [Maribacter]MDV7137897.1 lysylphosphatidylglycerol synthase transmembrane domain-containing protein [Maribacter sp. TH_r10]MRX62944.1 flippase-like domain-containing protein [Maribacter luteus]
MATSIKKSLKTILPIALGVFLVWYWYNSTSESDREQIIYHITNADLFWVSMSIILGIIAYLARAIRWNYLLRPLGYQPKLSNNLLIILISYFANLGIPRSGEILRATALTTYEGVPFEKGFGTIVTERVIDLIMLLTIITTTLFLQTEIILGFLQDKGVDFNKILLLLAIGLVAAIFFFLFIKKSTHGFALKIKKFVKGLLDGVLSIFKMKNKWSFVFYTIVIWACYIGMFVVIKNTVAETVELTISQLLVAFVAGAFAITTTNGGVGLYPIAVSKALAIFGISKVSGDAFGWIMWISQTIVVVVFGAISFLVLPLLNRNR